MPRRTWSLPLCGLAALACATASARVYVDARAAGSETGDTWHDARRTIRAALAVAGPGEEVWIAGGTYAEGGALEIGTPNLRMLGGFRGSETAAAQRSGGASTVIDGRNEYACLMVTATNVTLDGLTLQRGRSTGHGAGLFNAGANLVVNGCTIAGCAIATDSRRGGGIYSSQPMQLLNSVVRDNTNAVSQNGEGGGGLAFDCAGALLVSNTVFQANKANDACAGDETMYGAGGAIELLQAGQLTAVNCVFDGNGALHNEPTKNRRGGAIYLKAASGGGATLIHCTFYSNHVVRGRGGAVYSAGAPVSATNCIFWGNACTADNGSIAGRQVYSESGPVSIGYTCLPGLGTNDVYAGGLLALANVITNDPQFADAAGHDFHLQSTEGHWDPRSGLWLTDARSSLCIDRGAPGSPYGCEPQPNGGRANLGADGNTARASLSPPDEIPAVSHAPPAMIGRTTATLGVRLDQGRWADGIVYWGTRDGGTRADSWEHAAPVPDVLQDGCVSAVALPRVSPDTTYYYRGYAANPAGSAWAPATASFRTGPLQHGSRDPRVIHVSAGNTSAFQDGSCWTYAYSNLATAWDRLGGETNTLWIAAGTYPCSRPLQSGLPGLAVYGGFGGAETGSDQRDLLRHTTVLTGVRNGDPRQRCRLLDLSGAGARIDGLTLVGGTCLNDNDGGGALRSTGDALEVTDCTLVSNAALGRAGTGGALCLTGDTAVRRCTFLGNSSGAVGGGDGDGGAIYFRKAGGRLVIENAAFHGNTCVSAALDQPRKGGAVYADAGHDGRGEVTACTFCGNRAGSDGGAVAIVAGTLTVSYSIFWADTNSWQIAGYGGEIWGGSDSQLRLSHCNVDTNAIDGTGVRDLGPGLAGADPGFASMDAPVDLHLQSQFGRWTPDGFVNDPFTSPCLDLGAYRGTPQASRTR